MQLLLSLLTSLTLVASALSQTQGLNTSREYHLHTKIKDSQDGKTRFDNLWIVASHTGAGLNDAVLYENKTYAIKGFLNATNLTSPDGGFLQEQLFDLGGGFPYGMITADVNFYAGWEPVRINAGDGEGRFFMNSTGLQWTSAPGLSAAEDGFGGEFGFDDIKLFIGKYL